MAKHERIEARMPTAIALAASLITAIPARATSPVTAPNSTAAAPHTRLVKEGTMVTLVLYEAECDDNPQECPIADLGCPSRGEFTATV